MLHRKVVRDAILACLASGFNSAIAEASATYGVTAFDVDFSDGSQSLWIGRLNPEEVELSSLMILPGMTIYTDDMQDGSPRIIQGMQFSGSMMGCVDFYVRTREGRERFDSESLLDMVEDVILTLFRAYTWPISATASVVYSRRAAAQKGRFIELADGYAQSLSVQAQFEVSIP
jgi:hypothetical protein